MAPSGVRTARDRRDAAIERLVGTIASRVLRLLVRRGRLQRDDGALSAGFKFQGGRRNLNVIAGVAWFTEHSPLCEDPAHLPPD